MGERAGSRIYEGPRLHVLHLRGGKTSNSQETTLHSALEMASLSSLHSFPHIFNGKTETIPSRIHFAGKSSCILSSKSEGQGRRRVWRRRQLKKKDETLDLKMERMPFLEEQVRKIRESGKILSMDIERLMLSEENRFDFVNEVAAEAKAYVENNRDEYGFKKAILHVLSNRMNDAGSYRPEAYAESDPFKPGPGFMKDEL